MLTVDHYIPHIYDHISNWIHRIDNSVVSDVYGNVYWWMGQKSKMNTTATDTAEIAAPTTTTTTITTTTERNGMRKKAILLYKYNKIIKVRIGREMWLWNLYCTRTVVHRYVCLWRVWVWVYSVCVLWTAHVRRQQRNDKISKHEKIWNRNQCNWPFDYWLRIFMTTNGTK